MEAAVLEVVLDAGSADPADSAVDDHDLAVIDVAERGQVPAVPLSRPSGPTGARGFVARTTQTSMPAAVSRS